MKFSIRTPHPEPVFYPVSRRAFLAAGGSLIGFAALSQSLTIPRNQSGVSDAEMAFIQPRPARLDLWGRITDFGVPMYDTPNGKVIGFIAFNTVLPIFETLEAEPQGGNRMNRTWYRVKGGYLYTSSVQIIEPYHMPVEVSEIDTQIDGFAGFWAEAIVPYTVARNAPGGSPVADDHGDTVILFYGSTYRVIEVRQDDGGFNWYRIDDDKKGAGTFYALARHLRRIHPDDLAPISPGAAKRIHVSLADQRMDCYQDEKVVLSTLVSSGASGFSTPKGEHAVVYKQLSRHMYSDPEQEAFSDPNFFDLPGVPYNTFLTTLGHAIHGTFWHGDFGRPRSHGCLNVTPEVARWIFRWVEPHTPYEVVANGSAGEPGTPIIVE